MKQPSVVIVGHVCIDHNITEHATYRSWGSPAMYIADFYRRALGLRSTIITSYGADFVQYAKDVTLIPSEPQQPGTLLYRNIITPDHRTWYCEHTDYAAAPELTTDAVEALQTADICIVATILPNYPANYIQQIVSQLKPECVTALVSQGYLRTVTADNKIVTRDFVEAVDILPYFDITVLSDEDHPNAIDMAHTWKTMPQARNIILSQGADGASILTAEGSVHIPTTPVPEEEIIDSVGCGDVFLGSLVYEYFQHHDLPKAVAGAHISARKKLLAMNPDAEPELL
jgi:sugar/nucleoside kinase (ribokinase family)